MAQYINASKHSLILTDKVIAVGQSTSLAAKTLKLSGVSYWVAEGCLKPLNAPKKTPKENTEAIPKEIPEAVPVGFSDAESDEISLNTNEQESAVNEELVGEVITVEVSV